mgnify:CR=1 FL=1
MNKIIPFSFCDINFGSIKNSSLIHLLNSNYKESRIIVFADENTHDLCLNYLFDSCVNLEGADVIVLPLGEENKIIEISYQVMETLSEFRLERTDLIINLGGGVVTDMGGFISSIYKRGIDFIHIPTTLLGMIDASIGGKNGVNMGAFKNQIGIFRHPISIFIDPYFLNSLPHQELINGYAEMLKHALIFDNSHWLGINKMINEGCSITPELLLQSIAIKTHVVEKDPKEFGLRKILNFGHTFGHALEGFFMDKTPVSHGHCVALGICAESYLSLKREMIGKKDYLLIESVIRKLVPFIAFDQNSINDIYEIMKQDKKNENSKILCCLLSSMGKCEYNQNISEAEVMDAMYHLNLLAGSN